ncbi:biotin/lipoyl-binding protein [Massilia sp. Se16.2.3]|uniref:efflux RND transporter periplasmic adaptor subunit n=1 Tax=Massilia sp. Se16.2.3 TaxID=2709303 RepID=UPI002805BF1F|nr:biotin/lipoyl-binding protein [Massilia sp. Se16.2.3]
MDSNVSPNKAPKTDTERRRGKRIGTIVAVLAMAALAALAWYLTHRTPQGGRTGCGRHPRICWRGTWRRRTWRGGGRGGRGAPATTVGVATAEQANIPVTLEALGTVTPATVATVRPQVSGVLQKILFTEGQMVRAGQVLATIDPRQSEIALLQATGQRQRDEAQLENARLLLSRYRTLLEQDSIARRKSTPRPRSCASWKRP